MRDLITEQHPLGALLEETRGVVGVVLGTVEGELRAVVGSVRDADASAMVAAALTGELNKLGWLLGLGDLGVASLKATAAGLVFAQQSDAVVVIELDPRRPLGELETKLRSVTWAPEEDLLEVPMSNRVPAMPRHRASGPTRPRSASPAPPVEKPSPPAVPATAMPSSPIPATAMSPSPIPATGTPSSSLPATAMPSSPIPVAAMTAAARSSPAGGFPKRPTRPPPVSLPSQMKAGGNGPVFSGDLEEFALPDLLEFLRNSHRTGLLTCTTELGDGSVQLSRGMIIGADSPHALDLREHFLTSAQLAPERRRLLAALPLECFGDDMIESVLVARDLVPRDEVERARIARIYSAFREMMGWTTGRFSFDPAVPIVANPALALSAQSILMQIFQEQDEQGR